MKEKEQKPAEGDDRIRRLNECSDEELRGRIRRYCAYQERSTGEVEMKLREWKIPREKAGKLMDELKEEGFIDDARFVKAFIHGKLHINHWGKRKIVYELRGKGIPGKMIEAGLEDIPEEAYREILIKLLEKKLREIKGVKNLTIREKLINFAAGRGFEYDMILATLDHIKK
jgi:regulatory protein